MRSHPHKHSDHNKAESSIDKIPQEIWWDIFDHLIDDLMFFATTYTGKNWTIDAHEFTSLKEWDIYRTLERQRKILGSICWSWQLWAQSRRHHHIALETQSETFYLDLENAPNARRVSISANISQDIAPAFPSGVNWEIVTLQQWQAADFACILHPRLRRLQLSAIDDQARNYKLSLNALRLFKDLTWLDYRVSNSGPGAAPNLDRPPIILPSLQVLHYQSSGFFLFPLSQVILPSLQYLAIYCDIPASFVPLNDILLTYGQTIRSAIIHAHRDAHALLAYGQTIQSVIIHPPREPHHTHIVHFPPWYRFPKLEELVLSQQWSIHFEPVPQSHPLEKLVARHASFDALPSALEATNMRQLILLSAGWNRQSKLELDIDSPSRVQDVRSLVKKANKRGIRFAASWSSDELSSMTREEALAPNSKSKMNSKFVITKY
jgi:hypothetical protein